MKIFNLTQHESTPDQLTAGVQRRSDEDALLVRSLMTFEAAPTKGEMRKRAVLLAELVLKRLDEEPRMALIGGASYFIISLERALKERGVIPVHAFSRREMREEAMPDGSVKKSGVFRHLGFVSDERFSVDPRNLVDGGEGRCDEGNGD